MYICDLNTRDYNRLSNSIKNINNIISFYSSYRCKPGLSYLDACFKLYHLTGVLIGMLKALRVEHNVCFNLGEFSKFELTYYSDPSHSTLYKLVIVFTPDISASYDVIPNAK